MPESTSSALEKKSCFFGGDGLLSRCDLEFFCFKSRVKIHAVCTISMTWIVKSWLRAGESFSKLKRQTNRLTPVLSTAVGFLSCLLKRSRRRELCRFHRHQ